MRWLLVSFVVACSAPPRSAPRATSTAPVATPARDLAVAEPAPRKPEPEPRLNGKPWVVEQIHGHPADVIVLERRGGFGEHIDLAEPDFWPRCVRAFVAAQPATARISMNEMFARYITACDGDRVVLARPLGADGRERPAHSDVTFAGTLAPGRFEIVLRLTLCGESPDTDRVVIATDGERWTSPRVEVEKDDHGCENVELPVTRSFAKVVRHIVDARDASVRFEGLQRAADLAISDELKRDIAITLDALDTLEINR